MIKTINRLLVLPRLFYLVIAGVLTVAFLKEHFGFNTRDDYKLKRLPGLIRISCCTVGTSHILLNKQL
jgi:hypothetical protein